MNPINNSNERKQRDTQKMIHAELESSLSQKEKMSELDFHIWIVCMLLMTNSIRSTVTMSQ